MSRVSERGDGTASGPAPAAEYNHLGSIVVAVLVGVLLALTARAGAVQLLVAVAVVQALLALAWVFGTGMPGRRGALVIAAAAAAAADVTVSVWPHGRLGTLLAVLGLAVPAMFVHQLARGAVRVRAVASLGAVALLVLGEVALPSLLQLRHEFAPPRLGGEVVAGVAVIAAGALVIGYVVDLLFAAPRFDSDVPRGLFGLIASAGLGGSIGYLLLQSAPHAHFVGGRGAFIGASLGALIALFAVAVAFVEHDVPARRAAGAGGGGLARRVRPALSVALPLALLAPVAFLLCLAIRV
jgi:hypothetical protein